MPFVETSDKTKLFYNDWGRGRPVVLIHGWPLDADMWEYQAPAIAEAGYRVIAYDRRGFGRSEQPWSGYDYDTFADDLKVILDSLDCRDAALVGFSMGGGEVARYMTRHAGARVAKAVLVSAVTPFMLKTADNPDGVDASVFQQMVDGLKSDRPHFLTEFGSTFFGSGLLMSPASTELMQWTINVAMLASPRATTECVSAFSATDFRQDMARFTVPTMIVHGDNDKTVPIDKSARRAAAMIPGAHVKIYDGAPHAIPFTHAQQLTQDLLAFLKA